MKTKLIKITVIALSLIITYVAAGPYLAFSEIKAGIADQDSVKMSKNIDFPTLRQNIKEQINAVMMQSATEASSDNPFALIAAGVATAMTDRITESLITPTGLASIMHGKFTGKDSGATHQSTGKDNLFKDAKLSFDSLDTFSARVKNENGDEFRIVLQREGIQWKMTNIILPDQHALNQTTD